MFLNVTNHPVADWPEQQRTAARELGGQIVDSAFPDVPPDADTEGVRALGRETLASIAAKHPTAVLIQGEFTLAFFLVRELQSLGFPCYAATTRRLAQATSLADGTSLRTSRFEFVRFRSYG